jgi:hypothetical protein
VIAQAASTPSVVVPKLKGPQVFQPRHRHEQVVDMIGHVVAAIMPVGPAQLAAKGVTSAVMIEADEVALCEFPGNHAHIVRPVRLVPARVVVEIPRDDQVAVTAEVGTVLQASKERPGSSIKAFRTVVVIPRGEQAKGFRPVHMNRSHELDWIVGMKDRVRGCCR